MSEKNTPLSQQLGYMSKGMFDAEATEELAKVIKAVRETGKAGELVISIKVSMLNKRDENAVRLAPTCKAKIPATPPYETIMFSTADGDLLREDPQQRTLGLEVVDQGKKTLASA